MNKYVFTIARPSDRLHKPFESTWINGDTAKDAQELLARTYQPELGYVLTLKRDLAGDKHQKDHEKNLTLSLNSASL